MRKYGAILLMAVAFVAASCSTEKFGEEQLIQPEAQNVVSATVNAGVLNNGYQLGGDITVDLSTLPKTRGSLKLELKLLGTNTSSSSLPFKGEVVIDGEVIEINNTIPAFADRAVMNVDDSRVNTLLNEDPDQIVIRNIVITGRGGIDGDEGNGEGVEDIFISLEGIVTVPMV